MMREHYNPFLRIYLFGISGMVALLSACSDSQPNNYSTNQLESVQILEGRCSDCEDNNIKDRVFFDFDRYDIRPEARLVLNKWLVHLSIYPKDSLIVEGHADERGTREYNLALGEKRANAVKEFLVANGVQASRIKVNSLGKEHPLVTGSSEAIWAQNRAAVGRLQ